MVEKYLLAFQTDFCLHIRWKSHRKEARKTWYVATVFHTNNMLKMRFTSTLYSVFLTNNAPHPSRERAFSKCLRKFLQRSASVSTAEIQRHDCLVKPNWPKMYLRWVYFHSITVISLKLPQPDLSATAHARFHIHPAEEMQLMQVSVEASRKAVKVG